LCTPLAQMRTLVRQMLPALRRGAVVTDVGSVKGSVVKELEPIVTRAGAYFVGSHPMAGAEKNGVLAAHADMFENAVCVVTPTRKTNKAAAKKVESLWRSVGARVQRFSPERHDQLVSRSSHLPHMVAALLANRILDPKHPEQAALCATGFRDVTRIASGSPEMWRDIAMANRRNLVRGLAEFISDAKKLQRAIGRADDKSIAHLLEVAKQRRDKWCACLASPSPE